MVNFYFCRGLDFATLAAIALKESKLREITLDHRLYQYWR